MSLTWYLARKFSQQSAASTSPFSRASIIGLGIGCAAMLTLLSVMNGFQTALQSQLLAVIPHAELIAAEAPWLKSVATIQATLNQNDSVKHSFPVFQQEAMISQRGTLHPLMIKHLKDIGQYPTCRFNADTCQQPGLYLGQRVIDNLGLQIGQEINLLSAQQNTFKQPLLTKVTIAGALQIGGEEERYLAIMHAPQRQQFNRLELYLHEPFKAIEVIREIGNNLNQALFLSSWQRTHGHLWDDIQLVRVIIYLVLCMVLFVACFNIVSVLVMSVHNKRRQLAILQTLGLAPSHIYRVFVLAGMYTAGQGIIWGSVGGILLSISLPSVFQLLEQINGQALLNGDIYFISHLPSQIVASDIAFTIGLSLMLSMLASLYPARKAAQVSVLANITKH